MNLCGNMSESKSRKTNFSEEEQFLIVELG